MTPAPEARFSDRVADYVRARPGYPADALAAALRELIGLVPPARVADLGAGTGLSTIALRLAGFDVVAVEPNVAMRAAGERLLVDASGVRWADGTAEATGLPDASVEAIVAAQAFHWFDPAPARAETLRVLSPQAAGAALVWNQRRLAGSAFLEGYEALLLEFGTDYAEVRHDHRDASRLADFFGPAGWRELTLANAQRLDGEGFIARLLSSSYTPAADHPRRAPMLDAAHRLFDATAVEGVVEIVYDLRVIAGPMRQTDIAASRACEASR
jgi:SAM-dependent methyltransferase